MHSTPTYCEIISGVYGKAAEDATVNIHKICKIIDKNIEKAENQPSKRSVSDGADDALTERMNQTDLAHAI
jgi:predicted kinase